MSEPVISVRNIGKAYRIWNNPAGRLTSPILETMGRLLPRRAAGESWLQQRARSKFRDFWALRDISFEVVRGESWGIIGQNGSGKSTLLQIIAGTLQPTQGTVQVRGRVAALLELGAGFNPEFTGRENVYLNAAVLGFDREKTDSLIDAIAAFADIGDFFDQPVRTYSSGMVVRLAFAVSVHVEPDILIVDEALSVGDARFQLKCARAIDRFIEQGVTLLFVSHDASMVKRLCRHAVLLDHGAMLFSGAPNDVVNLYSKLTAEGNNAATIAPDIAALRSKSAPAAPPKDAPPPAAPPPPSETKADALLADERAHVPLSGQEFSYGGELGQIMSIAVLGNDAVPRLVFATGEPLTIRIRVRANQPCPEPIYALTIKNTAGMEVYGTNTLFSRQPAPAIAAGEVREVDFAFRVDLTPGEYFLSFGFTHFVGDKLVVFHRRYDAVKLEVHSTDRSFGIVNLKAAITTRTPGTP